MGPILHRAVELKRPQRSEQLPEPRPTEPDGWTEVDLGSIGRLFVSPGASYRLPGPLLPPESEYVVDLDNGELCAQVSHRDPARQGAFIVSSPSLRAIAVGTRFCVNADPSPDASWVVVEEGRVRVERLDGPAMLAGIGSLVRGREVDRLQPLLSGPATNGPVSTRSSDEQRSAAARGGAAACLSSRDAVAQENCLWRHAQRSDLGAQSALYLLGTQAHDRGEGTLALSIWQTYLRRFPHGVLVVETQLAVFDELIDERSYSEAVALSEQLERAAPTYFRLSEVEIRRGDLLAQELGRPVEAEQAYRRALHMESRPFLRERALYALGSCQEKLGKTAEARGSWAAYLREFPQGSHAMELAGRLDLNRQR